MKTRKDLAIIYRTKNKVNPWRIDLRVGNETMYAFDGRFPTYTMARGAVKLVYGPIECEKIGEGE